MAGYESGYSGGAGTASAWSGELHLIVLMSYSLCRQYRYGALF